MSLGISPPFVTEHLPLIRQGLEALAKRPKDSAGCVTFEANGQEHWLQYVPGQVNMDWPFAHAPEPQSLLKFFGAVAPLEVVAWDVDLFATFNLAKPEAEPLALAIDRVFQELYGLGQDYALAFKIEDL